MKCRYHTEQDICRLRAGFGSLDNSCKGEDKCISHQIDAKKECPLCGLEGASWSGWSGIDNKYTCWNCKKTWIEPTVLDEILEGICLRCGKAFKSPVPEVRNPGGNKEIATEHYCPDCNALVMSLVHRGGSAYMIPKVAGK